MTDNDTTMKVINWIHTYPSKNPIMMLLDSFISWRLSNSWRGKFTHGFSTGVPLNILIIDGKDPIFNNNILYPVYTEQNYLGRDQDDINLDRCPEGAPIYTGHSSVTFMFIVQSLFDGPDITIRLLSGLKWSWSWPGSSGNMGKHIGLDCDPDRDPDHLAPCKHFSCRVAHDRVIFLNLKCINCAARDFLCVMLLVIG